MYLELFLNREGFSFWIRFIRFKLEGATKQNEDWESIQSVLAMTNSLCLLALKSYIKLSKTRASYNACVLVTTLNLAERNHVFCELFRAIMNSHLTSLRSLENFSPFRSSSTFLHIRHKWFVLWKLKWITTLNHQMLQSHFLLSSLTSISTHFGNLLTVTHFLITQTSNNLCVINQFLRILRYFLLFSLYSVWIKLLTTCTSEFLICLFSN